MPLFCTRNHFKKIIILFFHQLFNFGNIVNIDIIITPSPEYSQLAKCTKIPALEKRRVGFGCYARVQYMQVNRLMKVLVECVEGYLLSVRKRGVRSGTRVVKN